VNYEARSDLTWLRNGLLLVFGLVGATTLGCCLVTTVAPLKRAVTPANGVGFLLVYLILIAITVVTWRGAEVPRTGGIARKTFLGLAFIGMLTFSCFVFFFAVCAAGGILSMRFH
jgi:hypothetical protein